MSSYERFDISRSDTLEALENRKFTQAMNLLRLVCAELDRGDFTLKDIMSFNSPANITVGWGGDGKINRFGRSHLKTLLEKGFIEEIEPGHYAVIREPIDVDGIDNGE